MSTVLSYEDFLAESQKDAKVDPRVKMGAAERLADFFRIPVGQLNKFNFDGSDDVKALSRVLNSTNDQGTKLYYDMAIKLAKEEYGINESLDEAAQTKAGSEFEENIGGILADTDIIQDVKYNTSSKELDVIPDGKLGNVDVSLIVALLQDKKNIEKIKKEFKGVKTIKFGKTTITV